MTTLSPVSALITVYHRIKADDLYWCLRSLAEQTHPAEQVVIVSDGTIGDDLQQVISNFAAAYREQYSADGATCELLGYPDNRGSAAASNEGLAHCTQEFIARLDSDDIAAPTRFEKQVEFLRSHTDVDILGTAIAEFDDGDWASYKNKTISTLATMNTKVRAMPETHQQIAAYAKINSPVNHPSSMLRRTALEDIGGYQHVHLMEDYDLWARFIAAGKKLHNLPEPLTYFRTSDAMFDRRTGREMFAAEKNMQANLRRYGLISRPRAILNLLVRSLYRALPRTALKRVYSILFNR